jgi:hypothetical protein
MKNGWLQWLVAQARELGPYLAIELILPGGTLIALGLWLLRRRAGLAQRTGVAP